MAWQGDTASPNSGGPVFIFSQEFVNCPVSPICFAAMRRAIVWPGDPGALIRRLAISIGNLDLDRDLYRHSDLSRHGPDMTWTILDLDPDSNRNTTGSMRLPN